MTIIPKNDLAKCIRILVNWAVWISDVEVVWSLSEIGTHLVSRFWHYPDFGHPDFKRLYWNSSPVFGHSQYKIELSVQKQVLWLVHPSVRHVKASGLWWATQWIRWWAAWVTVHSQNFLRALCAENCSPSHPTGKGPFINDVTQHLKNSKYSECPKSVFKTSQFQMFLLFGLFGFKN